MRMRAHMVINFRHNCITDNNCIYLTDGDADVYECYWYLMRFRTWYSHILVFVECEFWKKLIELNRLHSNKIVWFFFQFHFPQKIRHYYDFRDSSANDHIGDGSGGRGWISYRIYNYRSFDQHKFDRWQHEQHKRRKCQHNRRCRCRHRGQK